MKYSLFISGEVINLCVPSMRAIEDGWTDWFNDSNTTRWLSQGVFPNHHENQKDFYASLLCHDRFAVLICGKDKENTLYGIISISSIDWVARSGQISLVIGKKIPVKKLFQLEAMSLVTEHAFKVMGMERIWAGQAYPGLLRWNQYLELLGYQCDGVLRRGFVKGRFVSDSMIISCLYEDYIRLKEERLGSYWPGNDLMLKMVKKLPKKSKVIDINNLLLDIRQNVKNDITEINSMFFT